MRALGRPGHVDDQAPPADADEAAGQRRERRRAAALGAHGLGDAGDLVVEDRRRRLGRHVARRQAGPARGDDEPVRRGARDERLLDRPLLVGHDPPLDAEAELLRAGRRSRRPTRPAGCRRRSGRSPSARARSDHPPPRRHRPSGAPALADPARRPIAGLRPRTWPGAVDRAGRTVPLAALAAGLRDQPQRPHLDARARRP